MIMRYPGVIPAGLRIDSPVQNMDLMPTILDYAGIPLPDNLEAVNLRPLIEGQPPTTPRSIYAQVNAIDDPDNLLYWFFPRHHLRSIRQDEWKLIHSVGLVDGNELYRLQLNSLYEVENLVEQEPQRAAQMQSDLYDWFFRHQVFLPTEMK